MRRHERHTDAVDKAFDQLLEIAVREYSEKQKAMEPQLAKFSQWHVDLEAPKLTLSKGRDAQTLPITPIATYLPASSNWLWAWANDEIPESARHKSAQLKRLTDKTQYRIFVSPSFEVTAGEIDELCALALNELAGKAVFKAKNNEPWLFLVID
jgi:hypothetical protein